MWMAFILIHLKVTRVQIPNGTRQTTERPLSFTIDVLVEAP